MCQRLLGNGRDYHEIDLIAHWLEIQEQEFLALVLFFMVCTIVF